MSCPVTEVKAYYQSSLPFITCQTLKHGDTVPSVLEANSREITAQQEWEAEWNQAGLASRLSQQVGNQHSILILSPPNKLLSAIFLFCLIFKVLQSPSKLVKMLSECQTTWIQVRHRIYSASHPDPSCFAYGTLVVLDRLRVKST